MTLPESRQLEFDEIPVIDIGPLLDNSNATAVVAEIDQACRDIGFFYIVGHGFDMQLARHLRTAPSAACAALRPRDSRSSSPASDRSPATLRHKSQRPP